MEIELQRSTIRQTRDKVSHTSEAAQPFPLIPSHAQPTVEQVRANVEAMFGGVLDVIRSLNPLKFVHVVLMFDELATEKRIYWDPKTISQMILHLLTHKNHLVPSQMCKSQTCTLKLGLRSL